MSKFRKISLPIRNENIAANWNKRGKWRKEDAWMKLDGLVADFKSVAAEMQSGSTPPSERHFFIENGIGGVCR
jgi:hypothetical protein